MPSPRPPATAALFLFALLLLATHAAAQSPSPPSRAALTAFCTPASSNKYGACTLLLRAGCQSDAAKPGCSTLALLDALCSYDNPPTAADTLCRPYLSYCAANPAACAADKAWPKWTNSSVFQNQVYRMCKVHNMEGCDRCASPAASVAVPVEKLDACDSLATYAIMCKAMPDMTMCNAPWKGMCSEVKGAVQAFPAVCSAAALASDDSSSSTPGVSAPGTGTTADPVEQGSDPFAEIPPMRMYFHQDINDLLLFRGWVTRTRAQYWAATVGVFVLSFAYYAVTAAARRVVTPRIDAALADVHAQLSPSPSSVSTASSSSSTVLPTSTAVTPSASPTSLRVRRELLVAARAALATFELAYSFVLMLVVMAYNWGWCAAFLLGGFAGNMVFNRDPPPRRARHAPVSGYDSGEETVVVKQPTCH
ncbi:hypothetical protein H9P43_009061 [Blastocladiella emersonii ATCC 22665]|nr:hypothetical protein H9P43_009061 [Blastocladiella emersonii ATCC 22665]